MNRRNRMVMAPPQCNMQSGELWLGRDDDRFYHKDSMPIAFTIVYYFVSSLIDGLDL